MVRKYDGLSGHVEAHCECFCRKEDFYEAFTKEDFDDFFQDVEETCVVDADSSLKEGEDFLDLGEIAIGFGEGVECV